MLSSGSRWRLGRSRGVIAAVIGFVLMTANLRIAIAALSPVLPQIQRSLGLSSAMAGLLTTIPVVCFGAVAFAVPAMRRRASDHVLIAGALVALIAGIALRLAPTVLALFAGTVVLGAAIALSNVVLPSVVRAEFATRIPLMMGLYSMALSAGAAAGAGLTVPLERAFGIGWRPVLGIWALPAALALAVWLGEVGRHRRRNPLQPTGASRHDAAEAVAGRALWRDPIAWSVTGFMGLQSFGFYATLAFVPTLYQSHGLNAARAGWLLSYSNFPAILAALCAPLVARRMGRADVAVTVAVACCAAAFVALALDPVPLAYVWMTLLGIGQGTAIALALSFIVLRSPDPAHGARLSMMAQGCGYLLASLGPLLVGVVHDVAKSWSPAMYLLGALLIPQLVFGLRAAGDRVVGDAGSGGAPGMRAKMAR